MCVAVGEPEVERVGEWVGEGQGVAEGQGEVEGEVEGEVVRHTDTVRERDWVTVKDPEGDRLTEVLWEGHPEGLPLKPLPAALLDLLRVPLPERLGLGVAERLHVGLELREGLGVVERLHVGLGLWEELGVGVKVDWGGVRGESLDT